MPIIIPPKKTLSKKGSEEQTKTFVLIIDSQYEISVLDYNYKGQAMIRNIIAKYIGVHFTNSGEQFFLFVLPNDLGLAIGFDWAHIKDSSSSEDKKRLIELYRNRTIVSHNTKYYSVQVQDIIGPLDSFNGVVYDLQKEIR